jgi:cyclase
VLFFHLKTFINLGDGFVKGIRFKNHKYVGDPINAVKIFNDKEVDELIFLDITASSENRVPRLDLIQNLADECYMPFGVGGGISTVEQIKTILENGAEKVVINTAAIEKPALIQKASSIFGSQSIVVGIDVKKSWLTGERVYSHSGLRKTSLKPAVWAQKAEKLGAGEILLTSIENDGTMAGYNLDLIQRISKSVSIPVIASGGAGHIGHMKEAISQGASAACGGSMFVFTGKHHAVLINYPTKSDIINKFKVFNE